MPNHLKNVVLIDDDDATNFLHKRLVNKLNPSAHITVFNDGDAAFEYLISNSAKIDLVILDVNMPTLSGWEFLDSLPQTGFAGLPILLSSTYFGSSDGAKSYSHLQVKYLQKPISFQKLNDAIGNITISISAC